MCCHKIFNVPTDFLNPGSFLHPMPPKTRTLSKRAPKPQPVRALNRKGSTFSDESGASLDPAARKALALAALLFVVTIAVYVPVLWHPFVNYDDPDYVTDNIQVQQGLTVATVRWAFTTMDCANWHPLTWLSHALDCEIFGLHPSGHHASSLLLHALNAGLLFLLLWKATGKTARSLTVALLFAVHPINVESVAWVAERKSVLCMLFMLLTFGAYGWYARSRTMSRYLVVMLLFAFALAAKPMAVTLPFALLLLDIWPLGRLSSKLFPAAGPTESRLSFPALAKEKLPLFAMAAASCVITVIAQRRTIKPLQVMPMVPRLLNALYSYVMYIWKAFWPARLTIFYSPQGSNLAAWKVILCAAFLAAVTWAAWRLRSHSYFLVGWLWFLGTLVPMIGLVQVGDQGMADRYAYFSFLGIFVIVVWGVADAAESRGLDWRLSAVPAAAVIVALCFATRQQLETWKSNSAMWSHSLEISPDNYVAHDLAGLAISQQSYHNGGPPCPDEAVAHFQQAILLNPQDTLGQIDNGFCELQRGNFKDAIAHYELGLNSAPNAYLKSKAYFNLGGAYQGEGDFAAARIYYGRALEVYPQDQSVRTALTRVDALEHIEQVANSVSTHPTVPLYLQLGHLQQEAGFVQDARESYQRALALDPNSVPALNALRSLPTARP